MERTLSIIKPDAIARNLSGKINSIIEQKMKIVAQKMIHLTEKQASAFYYEHKDRAFFGELVQMMTSGPVVVQVLEAEDGIRLYREIIGATNPENAEEGTVRKQFGIDTGRNSVHGSANPEDAKREISFFFSELEIV